MHKSNILKLLLWGVVFGKVIDFFHKSLPPPKCCVRGYVRSLVCRSVRPFVCAISPKVMNGLL